MAIPQTSVVLKSATTRPRLLDLAQGAHDLFMEYEDLVPQTAVLFCQGEQALAK
jgi:hypothetical protein